MVRKRYFYKKIIWQSYMIQRISGGPKISHSNDKPPNSFVSRFTRISLQAKIIIFPFARKQKNIFSTNAQALDAFLYDPADGRSCPQWTLRSHVMSGRKLCLPDMMSAGHIFVISRPVVSQTRQCNPGSPATTGTQECQNYC